MAGRFPILTDENTAKGIANALADRERPDVPMRAAPFEKFAALMAA